MGVRGAALPRGGRRHGRPCARHGGRPAGPEGRPRLQRPARPLRTAPSRRVHVPRRRLPDFSGSSDRPYMSVLPDVMATVSYPSLGIRLPVRHGASDDTLRQGAGHLYGSSLPVGGKDAHTVLTGHTGLPDSLLFTRLDEARRGDVFYILVRGATLAYRVDRISVVDPSDTSLLRIHAGRTGPRSSPARRTASTRTVCLCPACAPACRSRRRIRRTRRATPRGAPWVWRPPSASAGCPSPPACRAVPSPAVIAFEGAPGTPHRGRT